SESQFPLPPWFWTNQLRPFFRAFSLSGVISHSPSARLRVTVDGTLSPPRTKRTTRSAERIIRFTPIQRPRTTSVGGMADAIQVGQLESIGDSTNEVTKKIRRSLGRLCYSRRSILLQREQAFAGSLLTWRTTIHIRLPL